MVHSIINLEFKIHLGQRKKQNKTKHHFEEQIATSTNEKFNEMNYTFEQPYLILPPHMLFDTFFYSTVHRAQHLELGEH